MLRSLAVAYAALAVAVPVQSAMAVEKTTITVDVSKTGAKIDRNIFGQFAEHLGHGIYDGIWVGKDSSIPNTRGIRNDVVAALKAIKVPNVRWPGGCFGDYYHWRHGIGANRPVTINTDWGGVTEPNTFGTHEFMDFVDQIGSNAYVSLNVGSGTVNEAADWMEYMTTALPTTLAKERAANGHPAPYAVTMLGLGNESWDCGGGMTPEYYASQMKAYSRFVNNKNPDQQTKNKMLKIAVGPGGDGPRWNEWTEVVMKAYKEHTWAWDIQGLSMHNYTVIDWKTKYPSINFDEKQYAEILSETLKTDDLIKTHSAIMDKYDPEKKVALIVDEWGTWYAPYPGSNPGFLVQQNSVRDAVVAALNINVFARHADRVRGANIAQMINVLQSMIITDKEKMVLTPTYYVFKMYVPFQDATVVPVTYNAGYYSVDSLKFKLPRIDAIAAKDTNGKLWIAVTNVDPNQAAQVELSVAGLKAKTVSGETLTGAKVDSINTFDAPNTVVPKKISGSISNGKIELKLEPKSVTVVSVD
jgi:alpha-N-arabinofuranosidase